MVAWFSLTATAKSIMRILESLQIAIDWKPFDWYWPIYAKWLFYSLSFPMDSRQRKVFSLAIPKMEIVSWFMRANQMEQRVTGWLAVVCLAATWDLLCKQIDWLACSFINRLTFEKFSNFMMTKMSTLNMRNCKWIFMRPKKKNETRTNSLILEFPCP